MVQWYTPWTLDKESLVQLLEGANFYITTVTVTVNHQNCDCACRMVSSFCEPNHPPTHSPIPYPSLGGSRHFGPNCPKPNQPTHPPTGHRPTPLCDIPSVCCFFTGPWTVPRSSLRMLRRVAAFCRPLRPVLLLVSFPCSQSPVVGVLGLCWMWQGVPFAR